MRLRPLWRTHTSYRMRAGRERSIGRRSYGNLPTCIATPRDEFERYAVDKWSGFATAYITWLLVQKRLVVRSQKFRMAGSECFPTLVALYHGRSSESVWPLDSSGPSELAGAKMASTT